MSPACNEDFTSNINNKIRNKAGARSKPTGHHNKQVNIT